MSKLLNNIAIEMTLDLTIYALAERYCEARLSVLLDC